MKYVSLHLDAGGSEATIHPMYDLWVNAPYIERATALHWNFTGTEFAIMHYVEGDLDAFRTDVGAISEVIAFEITYAGDDAFYVFVRDETTEQLRDLLGILTRSPTVVIPPLEYTDEGVSCSVFGPAEGIQSIVDGLPDSVDVTIREIRGFERVPGLDEARLSARQRDAAEAGLELGYYDIPRAATQADVADAIGCAPSTAAEHLRNAESKVIRAVLEH